MKEKRELLLAKLVLQKVDCSVMEDQNTKLVLQYCYNLILFRVGCSAIVGGVSKALECWMGYKLCVIFAMKHPYSTINTIKPFDMRPYTFVLLLGQHSIPYTLRQTTNKSKAALNLFMEAQEVNIF